MASNGKGLVLRFEATLRATDDKLRSYMGATEYKHVPCYDPGGMFFRSEIFAQAH